MYTESLRVCLCLGSYRRTSFVISVREYGTGLKGKSLAHSSPRGLESLSESDECECCSISDSGQSPNRVGKCIFLRTFYHVVMPYHLVQLRGGGGDHCPLGTRIDTARHKEEKLGRREPQPAELNDPSEFRLICHHLDHY